MNQGGMRTNQTGKATPFDNTSNGFTSIDVQGAIEELKGAAANGSMGTFVFTFTGIGLTSNEWLTATDGGIALEQTQFVVPFACRIIAVTCMSDTNNRDYDIEIHHASGSDTATTRDLIFQARNSRYFFASNFTAVSLTAGSRLAVYAVDQGDDASDLTVNIMLQVTSLSTANTSNNFSGDITRTASGGTTVSF